jgi:hypothetical protein
MEFRTVKVHMSGNGNYPRLWIIRDSDNRAVSRREYPMTPSRLKWLDDLFASHDGNIYTDFENSNVELMKVKEKP